MLENKQEMFDEFNPTKAIAQQMPKNIDFGFCCTGKKYTRIYKLHNYSDKPIEFGFTQTYFAIEPKGGIINPRSTEYINISAMFDQAKVIVAKTTLKVKGEESVVIKLSAVGKYPFFTLSKKIIQFDDILLAQNTTEIIEVKNVSEVGAEFFVEQVMDDEFDDGSIQIQQDKGFIGTKETVQLKIRYRPTIPDFLSYRRFKIRIYGGNEECVEVFGRSQKVAGRLDTYRIDFGQVKLGKRVGKTITLFNEVAQKLEYEIMACSGVFNATKKKSQVAASSYTRIKIIFEPKKPLNYFQRVYIFIRNQDIMYIDIFGSCADLLIKPLPLQLYTGESSEFQTNDINNTRFGPQTKIKRLPFSFTKYEKENFTNNVDMYDMRFINQPDYEKLNNEIEIYQNPSFSQADNNAIFKYMVNEHKYKSELFTVETRYVDFGKSSVGSQGISRYIDFSNHQDSDLYFHIFFHDVNFTIDTPTLCVPAKETKPLKITFAPNLVSTFYFVKVQLIVTTENPKEMITMSHGNNLVLTDYTIYLIGNTFVGKALPFVPMVDINPDKELLFPPCKVGQLVYQTFRISNLTDTPCLFNIEKINGPFKIYPQYGLISKNSYTNLIVEFSPSKPSFYKESLSVVLNTNHKKKLLLKGYCLQSFIELENNGSIYFPPSYLGVKTLVNYKIRNRGRMQVAVAIDVPSTYTKELLFEPDRLILAPNETKSVRCCFVPLKKMNYKIKCNIITDDDQDSKIIVHGEGSDGDLLLEPANLDLGIVMVNFVKTTQLTLHNKSDSTFNVRLNRKIENSMEDSTINNDLLIDFTEGIIPAKSKKTINLTFNPKSITDAKLYLEAFACANVADMQGYDTLKTVSVVVLKANYPLLKIIDIRNNELSLSSLWEKFNLSAINKELSKSLSIYEKKHSLNAKRLFDSVKDAEAFNRIFVWDFGYLHSNSKSKMERVVTMVVQNVGGTELEWNYRLDDSPKYEANTTAHINDVNSGPSNFVFKPKSGKLGPGDKQKIQIAYRPVEQLLEDEGEVEHALEGFLQIQNGKSIKLSCKGKTLSSVQGKLVVKSTAVSLPTLPVNLTVPAVVPIGIVNIGSSNLKYVLNKPEFYKKNNIDPNENLISFENSEQSLVPNEKKNLMVLFKPVEVKTYTFNVTLSVYDFFKEIQQIDFMFTGRGSNDENDINHNEFFKVEDDIEAEKQVLSPDDHVAYLSQEHLDFRNIEYGKTHKRVIFLYNNSPIESFSFEFTNYALLK